MYCTKSLNRRNSRHSNENVIRIQSNLTKGIKASRCPSFDKGFEPDLKLQLNYNNLIRVEMIQKLFLLFERKYR